MDKIKELLLKYVGFLIIAAGIVFIVISVVMVNNAQTYATATATVVDFTDFSTVDEPDYRITVEYKADGKSYTANMSSDGSDRIGDKITIYYDRNDPERIMDKRSVDNAFIPVAVGILFIALGTLYQVKKANPDLLPWIKLG